VLCATFQGQPRGSVQAVQGQPRQSVSVSRSTQVSHSQSDRGPEVQSIPSSVAQATALHGHDYCTGVKSHPVELEDNTPILSPEDTMQLGGAEFQDTDQHEQIVPVPELGATVVELGCLELTNTGQRDNLASSEIAFDLWKERMQTMALHGHLEMLKSEQGLAVTTQEDRVAAVRHIASMERTSFLKECTESIAVAHQARELDRLLDLPPGQISQRPYNPVVQAFIETLTKSISTEKKIPKNASCCNKKQWNA